MLLTQEYPGVILCNQNGIPIYWRELIRKNIEIQYDFMLAIKIGPGGNYDDRF